MAKLSDKILLSWIRQLPQKGGGDNMAASLWPITPLDDGQLETLRGLQLQIETGEGRSALPANDGTAADRVAAALKEAIEVSENLCCQRPGIGVENLGIEPFNVLRFGRDVATETQNITDPIARARKTYQIALAHDRLMPRGNQEWYQHHFQ